MTMKPVRKSVHIVPRIGLHWLICAATLRNYAENSKVYNINVANTYGKGEQALALSAYANNQGYYACQFTGYQG